MVKVLPQMLNMKMVGMMSEEKKMRMSISPFHISKHITLLSALLCEGCVEIENRAVSSCIQSLLGL